MPSNSNDQPDDETAPRGKEKFSAWIIQSDQKDSEHMTSVLMALHDESDRSLAIVVAAIVDNALTAAIQRHLHHHENAAESLFRTSGPLSSFSAKIDLGLLVGLYGTEAHNDLHTMRKIRNEFAHRLHISDFSSQPIKDKCANLLLVETRLVSDKALPTVLPPASRIVFDREAVLADPRERYFMTAQMLTFGLSIPSNTGMPPPLF